MPPVTDRSNPTSSAAQKIGRARLTLTIDRTDYAVRPLTRADLPIDAVRGFALTRADRRAGRITHAVAETFDGLVCSCGDNRYRQVPAGATCKHVRAAVACGLL